MSKVIYQAFYYRLYPTKEQQIVFNRWFGCTRKVYNETLAKSIAEYESGNKRFVNRSSFYSVIQDLKHDGQHDYLKDVYIQVLQKSVDRLLDGYNNFFSHRARFPQFKKKFDDKQSFKVPCSDYIRNNLDLENSRVWIPKLKQYVRFKQHRPLKERVVSYTISRQSSGTWHISFQCEVCKQSIKQKTKQIGLDFGIIDFIVTSDGQRVPARKPYRKSERKINNLQKKLSKKVKGSNNYNKLKRKLAKLHQHVANQRKDANHKLSSKLVNDNQVICIEDLKISNMSKNHKLAKSLLDEGWYQFTEMLKYKLEWYGGQLIKIDRYFASSKTCVVCGYKIKKLPLYIREWTCPQCGEVLDRDLNAAYNILYEGLKTLH